jgi:hypothetical protein
MIVNDLSLAIARNEATKQSSYGLSDTKERWIATAASRPLNDGVGQ